MAHHTHIKQGSIEETATGIAFVIVCCGVHEHSGHVAEAHRFTPSELKRLIQDEIGAVQQAHEAKATVRAAIASMAAEEKWLDADCPDCPKEASDGN